jgi:hypothetical protein
MQGTDGLAFAQSMSEGLVSLMVTILIFPVKITD